MNRVRTAQARPARIAAGVCLLLALPVVPVLGQTAADVARCQELHKHGDAGEAACWEGLTRSREPGIQAEGYWGLKDYFKANDAFRAAVAAHPKDANLRVRWGRLFLEHWQPADAGKLFEEALGIDKNNAGAYLGEAMIAEDSFEGKAAELAGKALAADPKLYEAGELMARVALEDNDEAKAVEDAQKALAISPEALDAMSILATVDWLDDKPQVMPPGQVNTSSPWIDKLFKVNPHYGDAYETAGYFFEINRCYPEAIAYYRKALEVEPTLQSARSKLGIALMRMGEATEAEDMLQGAWKAGWQDLPTKNSLTLLDSYKNFESFKTPTTILFLKKKEAALVRPYLQDQLNQVIATYNKKYHYTLPFPVQIEAYPDHEDFAVRTAGMPGLGALGVTFNSVIAMDSPTAADPQRPPGSFHWASTLWHEMSHVYVLSMTNERVPRWFTEGLAVYEETAEHPDWGDRLDHPSIMAIKEHKLLPVADLDRGYMHPTYPEQVIVSYFQGGEVITYIVQKWGYDKVQAMIHDFGQRMTTTEVIEKELGMKPEDFDKQFIPWIEAKTKTTVDGFDNWSKNMKVMNQAAVKKDWDTVITTGTAIRDLYPDYVEAGSVYEALAEAYLAKGDKAKALAQLKRYAEIGGRNPDTLGKLADMQVAGGDKHGAAVTLERVNLIYVRDDKVHQELGDLDMELGNPNGAIREYQALLADQPVDQAGAHYQLARALDAVHRTSDARDEVLSSLEVAPDFKPAQKLLLELSADKTNVTK